MSRTIFLTGAVADAYEGFGTALKALREAEARLNQVQREYVEYLDAHGDQWLWSADAAVQAAMDERNAALQRFLDAQRALRIACGYDDPHLLT